MPQQLINLQTGEFTLNNDFVISGRTTVSDLEDHFGKANLAVNDFKNGHCNYAVGNINIGEWYFMLTFYFLNEIITKIGFVVQAEPYGDTDSWESFDEKAEIKKGKYMEQWMAGQMQRDYKKYEWGSAGVNYDFHNLSSSCFIAYKEKD